MSLSKRIKIWITVLLMTVMLISPGCSWLRRKQEPAYRDTDYEIYKHAATAIEYPDVESCDFDELAATGRPRTLINRDPTEYWNMSLEECMHLALKNSKVLRNLGGAVLDAPESVQTVFDPARGEADPRFGVEAALSAFDAEWSTQAFFEKNDRLFNNQFFGGGIRDFKQDLLDYSSELSKQTATGAILSARHNAQYDFNNAPGNNPDPNLPWGTNFELEVRQPILQGAGVEFNRIAGPDATPGVYNGVMIARIRTDIALADFQEAVTNLVFSVEYLYWELYAAYRKLDAQIAARDRALETWRIVNSLKDQVGADEEAQAREQYYRLELQVQNALNGQQQEKASITAFRGTAGVYVNERRLRLLMGLPINDGRLIRPKNEPVMAKIVFDWHEALVEALMRRTVLRRQKWRIKQRELELVASKNFLRPRLDTIGRYRWRGLGHDLITDNQASNVESAFGNLLSGDFQEWQLGFELSFAAGRRKADAAVRNAELNLARDHALLREQEREVTHDLSNAIGELERAFVSAKLNYNRRLAAKQQLAALEAKARGDLRTQTRYLDLILDAQRRLADAESLYHNAMAEYMLAIRLVHRNKGSLLDYNEIHLAEGPWPEKAYGDAARRERLRVRSWHLENFVLENPLPFSRGPIPQDVDSTNAEPVPAEVIRTPETEASPLPPAPSSVGPDNGDRLFESTNYESTRRTIQESPETKKQPLASNPQVQPHFEQVAPAVTRVEKQVSSGDSQLRNHELIANRLPLDDMFRPNLPELNQSVLSGSLLDRALATSRSAQQRTARQSEPGPVVRFAAAMPNQETKPATRFAGGSIDLLGPPQNRQTGFDDSSKLPSVILRPSSAVTEPPDPVPARTLMPSATAQQPPRPDRPALQGSAAPASKPSEMIGSYPRTNGYPERSTQPVVRYSESSSMASGQPRPTSVPEAQRAAPSGPPTAAFQYPDTKSRTFAPAPIIEHVPADSRRQY